MFQLEVAVFNVAIIYLT